MVLYTVHGGSHSPVTVICICGKYNDIIIKLKLFSYINQVLSVQIVSNSLWSSTGLVGVEHFEYY